MRILVVEDDRDSSMFLERFLTSRGHTINTARNGIEALDIVAKSPPDIIVSDILMPEMDGFDLCKKIKSDDKSRHIPFIFYTATYTDRKDEKLAMSLGASKFIIKPMEPNSFLDAIEDVIEKHNLKDLPIPDHTLSVNSKLEEMHRDTLTRKLAKKIRELEEEKDLLHRSEQKYSRLIKNLRKEYLFYSHDTKGVFTYVSPSVEHILGYNENEFLTHYTEYLTDSPINKDVLTRTELAIKGKEQPPYDVEAIKKDGSLCLLKVREVPIFDEHNRVISVEGIARDITEHKKLEQQLLQAQKMEAVGQLAGGVAHDFNNILTAIISYSHLIRNKSGEDDLSRKNIDKILQLADRASSITKGLLSFSRSQYFDFAPTSLNSILRGIENLLTKFVGEEIELSFQLTRKPTSIIADKTQLEQVIINLSTNARDSMPDGGILTYSTDVVHIDNNFINTHGFGEPGLYSLITISDTGGGIEKESMNKIFDPFFTTKDPGVGTGLGLSVVYGIIKQHDGYINTFSKPGEGTTFEIYIPESKIEVTMNNSTELPNLMGNGETLLLAEDEPEVRESIKSILEEFNYKVLEASDGKSAVDIFSKHKDVIKLGIFDVVMPVMNGKEAFDEVKKISPDIKAIFTSGYTADVIKRKKVIDDNVPLVPKPILPDKFLAKIKEIIKG